MKNSNEIKSLLSRAQDMNGEVIERKTLVLLAKDAGLEEKALYPVLLPSARGSERGTYDVAKMLEVLEAKSSKKAKVKKPRGKKEKTADAIVAEVDSEVDVVDEGEVSGWTDPNVTGDPEVENVSGIVDYTEDDIAEELDAMGTSL